MTQWAIAWASSTHSWTMDRVLQLCTDSGAGIASQSGVSAARRRSRQGKSIPAISCHWTGADWPTASRRIAAVAGGEAKWSYRPSPAIGDFRVDWQVYLSSGRSLNSSRKPELGESGHRRPPTGDTRGIAADRRLSTRANARYRPILLKNSKMHSRHLRAKLNRYRQFDLRVAGGPIIWLKVGRIAEPRVPQRLKCNEGSVGQQFL